MSIDSIQKRNQSLNKEKPRDLVAQKARKIGINYQYPMTVVRMARQCGKSNMVQADYEQRMKKQ